MATRSRIGILNEEKMTVDSIYCHWDGYLEHVGRILHVHWKSTEDVRRLIELGDITSIGIDQRETERHDCSPPRIPARSHSLIRWVDSGQDYEYLFTPSLGTWSFRNTGVDIRGPWTLLSEALREDEEKSENPD